MLNSLRQQAGSWVVKILLLLLVVSFAIWGIGDIFYGGSRDPAVATVGDSEITSSELANAFNRSFEDLQRRLGPDIDRGQAISLGLMQQALQQLVAQRLVDLRAQEMGLTVADDTLRQLIVDTPTFQTAGAFDRSRFEQLLRASGMSEDGYLAALRQDLVRRTLADGIAGPVAVSPLLVDSLYRYRNEQRRGRYVSVSTEAITDLPDPDEETLQAIHEANEPRFTASEYRQLSFITLEPEDLIAEVEIAEELIETEYLARDAQFRTPERRTVRQLLATERAAIDKAVELIAEGQEFDGVAELLAEEGLIADELSDLTPGRLPAELDEVVFAAAGGEVTAPIESPFGWHLFEVVAIEPEEVQPLLEVRDELREELALQEARDRLPALANQLDDELAAGAALADAANRLGLELKTLAPVDAAGQSAEDVRPELLPPWPEFMRIAFETGANEPSLLEETDAGTYFVLQVDEIVAPRLKAVDEVRDELITIWQGEQRREKARERTEQLHARLNEVASLDSLSGEADLSVREITPLKRGDQGADQDLNPAAIQALFATEPGKIAEAVVDLGDRFAVIATDEIIPADPAADADGVADLEAELENESRNDVLAQFEAALRRDYAIEVDPAALDRLIGTDGVLPVGAAGSLPGAGGGIF